MKTTSYFNVQDSIYISFKVYTFGSNLYGQLGCGDILTKNVLQHVKLPCNAIGIAAGSNHSVVLTQTGEVYTFGNAHVSIFLHNIF